MTIFYELYDKLYVNLTNRCPCACTFCIRQGGDGVGSADSLWLEREPSVGEVKAAFNALNLEGMTEIVFCGYGEPMERAFDVIELAEYFKAACPLPVRINTNGLVSLIYPDFPVSSLMAVDSVSVSLNAENAGEYNRVTRPRFGLRAFEAMLSFAEEAKRYTDVVFTVVEVLDNPQIEKCREIAERMGIPLRIRGMM